MGGATAKFNIEKFNNTSAEIKENYNALVCKMDTMLESFADFRVYAEKNFKK